MLSGQQQHRTAATTEIDDSCIASKISIGLTTQPIPCPGAMRTVHSEYVRAEEFLPVEHLGQHAAELGFI
jgi:hypothetical protein